VAAKRSPTTRCALGVRGACLHFEQTHADLHQRKASIAEQQKAGIADTALSRASGRTKKGEGVRERERGNEEARGRKGKGRRRGGEVQCRFGGEPTCDHKASPRTRAASESLRRRPTSVHTRRDRGDGEGGGRGGEGQSCTASHPRRSCRA